MIDKVQKIREKVVGIINDTNPFSPDEDGKNSSYEAGKLDVALKILQVIDSLQEEPVSEDLEEAAMMHYKDVMEYEAKTGLKPAYMTSFKAGAKWQFEHQWVSVKDRLQIEEFDDGYTFVFVNIEIDEDTSRFDVDYIRNGKWELHPDMNITHWMPIPPIPNKED